MTKFYIDKDGKYLGAFEGTKPKDGLEVSSPPDHGKQIFKDGQWLPLDVKISALIEIQKLEGMITHRARREAQRNNAPIKVYNADGSLYCDDVYAEIERLEVEVLNRS